MAVELVGGAFLSAFLQTVFERLASEEIPKLFRGKKPIVDLLEELNTVLISANKLVNDAEEKQIKHQFVRKWLYKLNDAIYQADDLADTIDTEALRRDVEGDHRSTGMSKVLQWFQPDSLSEFDVKVENEATAILGRLKSLLDQKDALGLREVAVQSSSYQRTPAPLADESNVHGRKVDKDHIVTQLLSSGDGEENISVIPIVGMGGIGKTTLAHLAYNDDRVKDHFDLRAWVTVSEDFDIDRITKEILKSVTKVECSGNSLECREKLKEALREKRFLLVLDDVWNEIYNKWESLKSSFVSGAKGSRILVTTRNRSVSLVMAAGKIPYELPFFSPEESWELFSKHAFTDNAELNARQDLLKIGKEIVSKCKGLPLAIKSLGGLLRSQQTLKNWENILKSDVWDEEYRKEGNDILPALWLSYRHMPAHLKRCFSYCSMFPKDYEFRKEKIILMWMAEGFFSNGKQDTTMEELGDECFDDLVSRSLFQKSSRWESNFVMHDLIHDLAMFVSNGFCFNLDESNNFHSPTGQTRYLSHGWLYKKLEGIRNAKYLRAYVQLQRCRYTPLDELFLTSGRYLRVLCLYDCSIKKVPDLIGNLILLRYLDLSHCEMEELPDSICSLYNLQTLILSYCRRLKALPKNMEKLIKLRFLDITEVPLKEMGFQIKNMKSLRTLSNIIVGNVDNKFEINELKEIQPFRGRLEISRIENVGNAKEAFAADLKDKNGVTELILKWDYESGNHANSSEEERAMLDSLRPHINVRELKIEGYRGTRFADWVGHDSFCHIAKISLAKCKSCSILPPLGQLRCLKRLYISGFDSVVVVGDELYGDTSTPFICLEILSISDMPQWKEWLIGRVVFPCLARLEVESCPELEIRSLGTRSCLDVDTCPKLNELSGLKCESILYSDLQRLSLLECLSIDHWEGDRFPHRDGWLPSSLTYIEISNCSSLVGLNGRAFQQLTSLQFLRIGGWKGDSFPDREGSLPLSLYSIEISDSSSLVGLNGKAFQQLTSLEMLEISECPKLGLLPEEGLPASLSHLQISGCPLLEQRCEKDEGEDWPKIAHIEDVEVKS